MSDKKYSNLLILAAVGLGVAGLSFLTAFLTTQKAKTPLINQLKVISPKLPSKPPLPSLPPGYQRLPLVATPTAQESTLSATETPDLIEVPEETENIFDSL